MIAGLSATRLRFVAQSGLLLTALPVVLGAEWIFGDMAGQPDWISHPPAAAAVRWLESHGLSHGVGEYWSSSLLSALSRDTICIAPVAPAGATLQPYIVAASRRWYAQAPQFVIWQDFNPMGVTLQNVRATYAGRVRQVARVAGYRIALLAP